MQPFTEKLKFTSFALTEPGAGSDVAGIPSCTARRDGDHYVVNGSKAFITNGEYADQVSRSSATTDKTKRNKGIICLRRLEGRPKGLTVGKHENKMGQRASNYTPPSRSRLRRRASSVANRIGEEGEGFRIAMETLDNSRGRSLRMFAIGIARAALEHAMDYASQRASSSASPSGSYQAIQFMLADMAKDIEAARLLTWQSAWLLDPGSEKDPRLELREGLRGGHGDAGDD